jgi:hypothetical protein
MLLNSALRWLLVMLNFLPDFLCRILLGPSYVDVNCLNECALPDYPAANFPGAYQATALLAPKYL